MGSRFANSRPKRKAPLVERPPWLTLMIIFVVAALGQIALSVTIVATVSQRLDRIEARIEVLER